MSDLAPVLQEFFTRRLVSQRDASPATIAAYRDTFRLLPGFAAGRARKTPSTLGIADLDAPMITAFLQHLQDERGNSARTRNARLAAVHSFFSYAALSHPGHGALIQRVLAIPGKRRDRTGVTYLTPDEADALLAACDQSNRTGRRDHAMLALAIQAGLRVSELTSLTCDSIRIQAGPHVHCTGKGRKERDTPLLPAVARILKTWLAERDGEPGRAAVPRPVRAATVPRRRRAAREALPPAGVRRLPVPGRQARDRPHPETLGRHALAARRRRHHRHRPVARPRVPHQHTGIHPRRHAAEAGSNREDRPARHQAETLPAPGPAPGVPREPLSQNPRLRRQQRPWHTCDQGRCALAGITGGSA